MVPPRSRLFCCSGVSAPPRPPRSAPRPRTFSDPFGDELHAARRVVPALTPDQRSRHPAPSGRACVSIAWMTTSTSLSRSQRAIVGRRRTCRPPCRASRWRGAPGCASADPRRAGPRASAPRRARPSPSSVQSAWNRASWILRRPNHRLERRRDRPVLLQDQQLLRRVAPPAVRMRQMRDELGRRFVEHARAACDRARCRRRSGARRGRARSPCPADTG